MTAYYNEIDDYCVRWLRNLIAADLIAPGDVDSRPIQEVKPEDLDGYTQCHFFAGLGGWSYAARLAGWPDSRAIWTGSCPCQPFSVAGKGLGEADPRHLWPYFFPLIRARRPAVVMGEQTSQQAGYDWFDGVAADLESEGFECRAVDIPSASVGAPHKRNRLYWVANSASSRLEERQVERRDPREERAAAFGDCAADDRLDNSAVARHGEAGRRPSREIRDGARRQESERRGGDADRMGNPDGSERRQDAEGRCHDDERADSRRQEAAGGSELAGSAGNGMENSYLSISERDTRQGPGYAEAQRPRAHSELAGRSVHPWDDWVLIGPDPDGKYRRIESGVTPLAARLPGHVDQIRAFGNAITPWLAAEVIGAYMVAEQATLGL